MKLGEPYIVGLAGPSCSGKSSLAVAVQKEYEPGTVTIVDMDSYYMDLSHLSLEQRQQRNFDCPEAFDTALLFDHIDSLKAGNKIKMPVYDFTLHCRQKEVIIIAPSPIIIIDGIFALHFEQLRRNYDLKIYLDIDESIMLERRIDRDFRERARGELSVRRQFTSTVRPMNRKYIVPSGKYADMVLDGRESVDILSKTMIAVLQRKTVR